MTIDPALRVERFRCQYLIPADHPSLESVKARLDSAVQARLARSLAALLGRMVPASGEGIWLIRRLDVDLSVNMAWEFDRLAEQWAFSIARKLAYILQGDGGDPDALYFPDHPSYLARFLLDLVQGSAWSCWYYAPFEGMRLLPLSAALRTAICEDLSTGIRALLRIDAASTAQVVRGMNAGDARRVLAVLMGRDSSDLSFPETREGLLHYVDALRVLTGEGGDAASVEKAWRSVEMSDWTAAYLRSAVQSAEAGEMFSSARWNDPAVKERLRSLVGDRAQTTAGMEARFTPYGGVFLLLPMLAALNLEDTVTDWPAAGEVSPLIALRFTLLLKCLGQWNTRRALMDSLLRDLLAVPPELEEEALKRWQARLSPTQLDKLLFTIRDWNTPPNNLERQEWLLVRVPRPGRSIALLLDTYLGTWHFAAGFSSRSRHMLTDRLHVALQDISPDDALLCDSSLKDLAAAAWKGNQIRLLESDFAETRKVPGEKPSSESDFPVPFDQLSADLDYLSFPAEIRGPSPVDLALSVVAQNLLRAFARRLPGFSHSGLPYLYANFLDFPASLKEESERRAVSLGQPPLGLILNITGMARSTYHLDWLDERPFTLHLEN
jgi:hypothetical protein